jgi:hypothetical protein
MADFGSVAKVKEHWERMQARMKNFREKNEKNIERGFAIVEVTGSLFAWGYANERWGQTTDPLGLKEITVVGVPADLGAGIGLLAVGLFGGLGKYAEHGINLGSGSAGAFAYRMGAELGRKGAAPAAGTTTAGALPTGQQARMPYGGRQHHVTYAQR